MKGTILHKANNLVEREAEILRSLKKLKAAPNTAGRSRSSDRR